MGNSLSDIPGAGGGGKSRRGRGSSTGSPTQAWRPAPKKSVSDRSASRRPTPRFTPRLEIDRVNLLLAAAFAALLIIGAIWLIESNRVSLVMSGAEDGGAVTTDEAGSLMLEFTIEPAARAAAASLQLDGEDVMNRTQQTDTSLLWSPDPADPLKEGDHEFTLSVSRSVAGTARRTFDLAVDDTEPVVDVDPVDPVSLDEPLTISGQIDEAVTLTFGDRTHEVDDDGAFAIEFDVAPAGRLDLLATDPAGNSTLSEVVIPVRYPPTHAIHLGADSWANESVRSAVLDQMGNGFDAVVLDVKDECGQLSADLDIAVARQAGATTDRVDLADAAAAIHEAGGRAIARVVAFRDPVLTAWAWSNGHPDWVLQDTSSSPWPDFTAPDECVDPGVAPPLGGGAAAFAQPPVQDYVIDVVRAASDAGFDDVLLDDVRRPSGDPENLKLDLTQVEVDFEAEDASSDPVAEVLTDFLDRARRAARSGGAYVGVTASGLSVRDPAVYSQDLSRFASVVDYIAPEVYPESYSSGFFNLDSPISAPGEAVAGALAEAREQIGDAPVQLVPWLQDYSGSVPYGLAEIQAQIDGAAGAGSCSYILEDPDRNYTAGVSANC
jgi:hypothetical protein